MSEGSLKMFNVYLFDDGLKTTLKIELSVFCVLTLHIYTDKHAQIPTRNSNSIIKHVIIISCTHIQCVEITTGS